MEKHETEGDYLGCFSDQKAIEEAVETLEKGHLDLFPFHAHCGAGLDRSTYDRSDEDTPDPFCRR